MNNLNYFRTSSDIASDNIASNLQTLLINVEKTQLGNVLAYIERNGNDVTGTPVYTISVYDVNTLNNVTSKIVNNANHFKYQLNKRDRIVVKSYSLDEDLKYLLK